MNAVFLLPAFKLLHPNSVVLASLLILSLLDKKFRYNRNEMNAVFDFVQTLTS